MDNFRLSDNEKAIINACYLNADLSLAEISKITGIRSHVVNYSLQKLKDEGIIKKQVFISTYALGYYQGEIYFSLSTGDQAKIKKLERTLCSSDIVPWVGTYGGEFQYGMTFCIKEIKDIFSLSKDLFKGQESIIRDTAFSIRNFYKEYSLKNLVVAKKQKTSHLSFGEVSEISKIDSLDHEILKFMSEFPEVSTRRLAEKLGLPASSIYLRQESLKKRGILIGYSYVVNFSKLGLLTYLYILKLKTLETKILVALEKFAEAHPDVIYMTKSYGAWDVKIGVNVWQASDSVRILQEIYNEFGDSISNSKTLSAFEYLKVTRYPFGEKP